MYWYLKIFYRDIAKEESKEALKSMGVVDEDLGVCPLPDASPSIRYIWILLTEITFLFSENNIQIKIFILIYNITLNYRQVCSDVFDGVTGDHADHNDEF